MQPYQNGYYSQQQQTNPQTYSYNGQQQPASVYQQRLSYLEQQNPQFSAQQNTQQQSINSVAVTSIDEARAYPIPFDNGIYVFLDMSNGKIYTKQFDFNTGGSHFKEYSPETSTVASQEATNEVLSDNPGNSASEDINMLKQEIKALKQEVSDLKGEIKNGLNEHGNANGTGRSADAADSSGASIVTEPAADSTASSADEPTDS